jgi:hypothetical protein
MNRTLKRPMFRIGGSAGTGITSGLDRTGYAGKEPTFKEYLEGLNQEQKQMQRDNLFKNYQEFLRRRQVAEQKTMAADGGRIGYANGTGMPNFQPSGIPGFLTGLGLNLLATPPQGNIFQTIGTAAQDPFNRLQAQQASLMKTASDRKFARELAQEEREFEEGQLEKKLAAQERIAGMKTTDTTERIQAIADTKYDGDTIKASREVNFPDEIYPNLISEYGEQTVATSVIDTSGLQKQKDIDRFVKQNPQLARQVVYDVRTGKAVRFGLVNGKYTIQPADPKDKDDTGFAMPDPDKPTPGLFGQETKPGKTLKEILPDFRDPGFDESFYQ